MIKIIPKFLSDYQVEQLLNKYSTLPGRKVQDNIYNFESIDLNNFKQEIFKLIPKIKSNKYHQLRLQLINSNIKVSENFHVDEFPFSFMIFLNSLKDEGELQIQNVTIKPVKGMLVAIDGESLHKVHQSNSDRWTLVGFLSEDLFQLSYSSVNKPIL